MGFLAQNSWAFFARPEPGPARKMLRSKNTPITSQKNNESTKTGK
jgi:hypothetical protein